MEQLISGIDAEPAIALPAPAVSAPASLLRAVVVAPTFNHVGTLIGVLKRVEALGVPVIVVNDGSTDGTAAALAAWSTKEHGRVPEAEDSAQARAVHVVTHKANRGKAAALRSGFDEAARLGFTHAVTIDSDGQHDPADIPALLQAAERDPRALVLGERSDKLANYPRSSLIGRRLTNQAIRVACGAVVSDSQCGLRVYPLELVRTVPCRGERFAFESEVITRAVWAGWRIERVPVTSWYAPAGKRISHFRGFKDSMQWVRLQCRLLLRAAIPAKRRQRSHAPAPSSC